MVKRGNEGYQNEVEAWSWRYPDRFGCWYFSYELWHCTCRGNNASTAAAAAARRAAFAAPTDAAAARNGNEGAAPTDAAVREAGGATAADAAGAEVNDAEALSPSRADGLLQALRKSERERSCYRSPRNSAAPGGAAGVYTGNIALGRGGSTSQHWPSDDRCSERRAPVRLALASSTRALDREPVGARRLHPAANIAAGLR